MTTFPVLSTGVVAQYPTPLTSGQAVQVIRFIDGGDQRFLTQGGLLRQWEIRLELLRDTEMAQLEGFFAEMAGAYGLFNFPDPFSGSLVPNCRLAADGMESVTSSVNVGATFLWVIETNG